MKALKLTLFFIFLMVFMFSAYIEQYEVAAFALCAVVVTAMFTLEGPEVHR